MRDQATRCNPVKSVFGVTRRVLIYRLPRRREAKAAVLSRRVDVDLLVYSQRIALSAKIRETASRKAFSVLGLSISRETEYTPLASRLITNEEGNTKHGVSSRGAVR